jgi:hypothetical protein
MSLLYFQAMNTFTQKITNLLRTTVGNPRAVKLVPYRTLVLQRGDYLWKPYFSKNICTIFWAVTPNSETESRDCVKEELMCCTQFLACKAVNTALGSTLGRSPGSDLTAQHRHPYPKERRKNHRFFKKSDRISLFFSERALFKISLSCSPIGSRKSGLYLMLRAHSFRRKLRAPNRLRWSPTSGLCNLVAQKPYGF